MRALLFCILFISGIIFGQENNDGVIYEEKSVYFKEGQDKIILSDGDLYYGEFIEKSWKKITFQREYEASKDTFNIKEVRLLVLANGQTVVRERKTLRPICFGISIYFILYFSLLIKS